MRKKLTLIVLALLLLAGASGALSESVFDANDSLLRLVNKEHKVTKNYVPKLVKPNVPVNKKGQEESIYMRPEAAKALEKLFKAGAKKGHKFLAVSGYRTYFEQQANYNRKVANSGRNQTTVAPAGSSEHQLGLAMDLVCESYRYLNTDPLMATKEFKWLYKNYYKYGFVVRYTREWKSVTGFSGEAWHLRYLGVPNAAALTWLNIPYETYVEKARELPEYVLTEGNAYLLYGLMDDALNGDSIMFTAFCAAPWDTEELKRQNIEQYTQMLLPKGVTLEYALSGKVK